MAWALQFDGVNDQAILATPIINPIPIGASLTFVGTWENTGSAFQMLIDIYIGGGDYIAINSSGKITSRISSFSSTGSAILTSLSEFTLIISRTSIEYIFNLNGVEQYRVPRGTSDLGGTNGLTGFSDTSFLFKGQLKSCTISTAKWDATASSHVAGVPILTDTVGGNNATGVNMPTDGSAWINLGGAGQSIAIDSGIYSYTGTSLSLKYDSLIQLQSGLYSLTGTALSLIKGISLLANSGNYSLTGSQADLLKASRVIANNGIFNLSGTSLTLTYVAANKSIAIDSGNIILFGTSNQLLTQKNTILNSGTYSLIGENNSLLAQYNTTAQNGNYTLVGTNITTLVNYDIIASSVNYNLTGYSLSLKYSGDVFQNIGNVGASFKANTVNAGFKIGVVTVNYKQDTTVKFN